VNSTFNQSEIA